MTAERAAACGQRAANIHELASGYDVARRTVSAATPAYVESEER